MNKLYLRLVALVTGGQLVYLQKFNKQIHLSIAYIDAWGNHYAFVYPLTRIGHCVLLADGTVDPCSDSNYVKFWKPA